MEADPRRRGLNGAERLVERLRITDPDRLAMAMLAVPEARTRLLTLYALNAELARTALSARDPLVAEMRVQWWVDRLEAMADGPPPPHELLTPLWRAWGTGAAGLASLAEARRHDAMRQPLAGVSAVLDYAEATGQALMVHAAGVMGVGDSPAARPQGRGAALTAWLRARPALQELGLGLDRADPRVIRSLADIAAADFAQAAAVRRTVPRTAAPVFFAGPGAARALAAIRGGDEAAAVSEFARRAALARLALTGRWWI